VSGENTYDYDRAEYERLGDLVLEEQYSVVLSQLREFCARYPAAVDPKLLLASTLHMAAGTAEEQGWERSEVEAFAREATQVLEAAHRMHPNVPAVCVDLADFCGDDDEG